MANGDDCTTNGEEKTYVKFTPRDSNVEKSVAEIDYCDEENGTGTCTWQPDPVSWNSKTPFRICRVNDSEFNFYAISFWGEDHAENPEDREKLTQVVRSFKKDKGGDAKYKGITYVEGVSVTPEEITFTVCNCEGGDESGGYLSIQVTIESGGKFLTSMDPRCELVPKNASS